jgi:hypothetical protein
MKKRTGLWIFLAVLVLTVIAMGIMLAGCTTPAAQLTASIDTLMNDAPKAQGAATDTKTATAKTVTDAKALDTAIPSTAPYKPLAKTVVADAANADTKAQAAVAATAQVVTDANAVKTTVAPVLAENAKLQKESNGWFAIVVQFLPAGLLVAFGILAFIFIPGPPSPWSVIKTPVIIACGALALLYTMWQVITLIPLWIYIGAFITVGLAVAGYFAYRAGILHSWLTKVTTAVSKSPDAVNIATAVNAAGTPGMSKEITTPANATVILPQPPQQAITATVEAASASTEPTPTSTPTPTI